jgi:hypothetical protein
MPSRFRPFLLISVLASVAAGPTTEPAPAPATPTAAVDKRGPAIAQPSAGGAPTKQFDFDGNGIIEVREYRSGSSLQRAEMDLDGDGQVDVWTLYDGQGRISSEMMDGDFDGKVDVVDTYSDGQRVQTDIDIDYDGRIDVTWTFANGVRTGQKRYGK